MCTLVKELFNCYDYFMRLSGFPDLFGKVLLNSPNLIFHLTFCQDQCNSYEFTFVIIESKHIYYSLSMTHKITRVLLQIIRLKTLIPDLLNWLHHPEQILPFSQVNYLSVSSGKKLSCSVYSHSPHPHIYMKRLSSR